MQGHNIETNHPQNHQVMDELVVMLLELLKVDLDDEKRTTAMLVFFGKWLLWLEEDSGIKLNSFYAAVQFFSSKYELSAGFRQALYLIRKFMITGQDKISLSSRVYDLDQFMRSVAGHMLQIIDPVTAYNFPDFGILNTSIESKKYWPIMEFECHKIIEDAIIGYAYELSNEELKVTIRDEYERHLFSKQLSEFGTIQQRSTKLNLTKLQLTEDDNLSCNGFIIMPDFLIDVSSVANCFQPKSNHHQNYLMHKMHPTTKSDALIIGNIVNDLLDTLVRKPDTSLSDLYEDIFDRHALLLSMRNDEEIRSIISKLSSHFINLKQTISIDFSKLNLEVSTIYLEPSFYNIDYGLQGRLDVYFESIDQDDNRTAIIELKSGQPFMANEYGLSISHYVQTILYDLLTRVQSRRKGKHENYILYSSLHQNRLKYAPVSSNICQQALAWRNELVMYEMKMARIKGEDNLLDILDLDPSSLMGYSKRDVSNFSSTYLQLDSVERVYYNLYVGFLSREYHLGKMGHRQSDRILGQSMLWQAPIDLKEKSFSILTGLLIHDNRSDQLGPIIVLEKSELSQDVSYFREGDLVLMYPNIVGSRPDSFQLTKAKISKINDGQIEIRLRAPQRNLVFYQSYQYWSLEPDFLDSSFRQSFHSLFIWAKSKRNLRQMWLGRVKPALPSTQNHIEFKNDLSASQSLVVNEALNAQDYYLIWGPPGSGKTSRVLATITDYIHRHTDQNLLIAAYTNRAVDEICMVIENKGMKFIRLGSDVSVPVHLHEHLLQNHMKACKSRAEVKKLLANSSLVIGTVASIQSKPELFEYIKFDRLIIDEASQILEPHLLSLLCRIPKVILIGDHKQLPAVVLQDKSQSKIEDENLNALQILDCRNALFDRLFLQLQTNCWSWSYGCLWEQGRMHHDICEFVSHQFYDAKLKINPNLKHLTAALDFDYSGELQYEQLRHSRMLFVESDMSSDEKTYFDKKNEAEAEIIAQLLSDLSSLYGKSYIESGKVGIITPFRAQIACIGGYLNNQLSIDSKAITIDTVERYQGGARDIIIYSTCIRHVGQLAQIQSEDHLGVDRKLNVVLSRAREQIIMIGHRNALKDNGPYEAYIESSMTR